MRCISATGRFAIRLALIALIESIKYTRPRVRERLSPGGLRGLQIRRGAFEMSSVGSTPIRSRQLGLLV